MPLFPILYHAGRENNQSEMKSDPHLEDRVVSALAEMMKAHTRLNNYLERGIVPDDLKRS
jgi:hypothetical protein